MRTGLLACALAYVFSAAACATQPSTAQQVENDGSAAGIRTVVEVSALANGAKFIADGTGGVEVVIRDAATGQELARGIAKGGTGDTDLIMDEQGGFHENVVTPDVAVFRTEIPLEQPRLVEVSVRGPLGHPIAETIASSKYWLIPGEHREGERRIVEILSGYIIDIQDIAVNDAGTGRVSVSLRMLCGCPIKPDGLWDANDISMHARLVTAEGVSEEVALQYSGEGTVYTAKFAGKTRQPRRLEVRVVGKSDTNAGFVVVPLLD